MKINIGSTTYNVHLKPTSAITKVATDNAEDVEVAGLCDSMTEDIYVSSDFPVESRKRIFYHELTHGILTEIGSEKNDDENFVDALARQIYLLFKKNNMKKIEEYISR